MKTLEMTEKAVHDLEVLKKLTTTVYICQVLTFALLLVGVAINLYNRNAVQGTWLQSHFDWQIKTVWITLAGFALAGFSFGLNLEIGLLILLPTLLLLVYRITVGWMSLSSNKPIKDMD